MWLCIIDATNVHVGCLIATVEYLISFVALTCFLCLRLQSYGRGLVQRSAPLCSNSNAHERVCTILFYSVCWWSVCSNCIIRPRVIFELKFIIHVNVNRIMFECCVCDRICFWYQIMCFDVIDFYLVVESTLHSTVVLVLSLRCDVRLG